MKKYLVILVAVGLITECKQRPPSLLLSDAAPQPMMPKAALQDQPDISSAPSPDDLQNMSTLSAKESAQVPQPAPAPLQEDAALELINKAAQTAAEQVQGGQKASPSNDQDLTGIEPVQAFAADEGQVLPEDDSTGSAANTDKKNDALKPFIDPQFQFDIEKKRKRVIDLVTRAAREVARTDIKFEDVCNKLTHTKEFIEGDLYVFVYDMKGTVLANGEESASIWTDRWELTDWVGTKLIQDIIKKARSGGGWVTYGWHNTTKVSYVQRVDREGISYAIGAGYYPQSKEEAVVNLVKGGVALFNEIKKIGQPADWAFSRMSYPSGRFVAGNLYLYALDYKGSIVAQGERPGLIGSNALDYKDEKGFAANKAIIKKLETAAEGVWVDYISKRAKKRAYAEKVVGTDGKKYFIACGYYPDATREQVEGLVRSGYQIMKTSGLSTAVSAFESRTDSAYRYGDLFLIVYDMKGKVIANGDNIDAQGQDRWQEKDDDGQLYIQNMIKTATKLGSWSNAKVKGSFESTFVQRIDLGLESYVIACSYYPVSKNETLMLLVQSAAGYLRDNPREKAFAEFVKTNGNFHRGDLQIVVVDDAGFCFAYGDDTALVWRNILNVADDDGRPFIKQFINRAAQGPDFINIKLNQATKVNYVTMLEKDSHRYTISSGFYQ